MVTSPGSTSEPSGSTSGSGSAPSVPVPSPSSTSSAGTALGPVDTGVIDASADRYRQVGEQMQRIALQAAALARYVPTFGGAPDQTWNAFITQGYGDAAQNASDALTGAAKVIAALADTSQQVSTLFTRTEDQAVEVAGGLQRALDVGQGQGSQSPADGRSPQQDQAASRHPAEQARVLADATLTERRPAPAASGPEPTGSAGS